MLYKKIVVNIIYTLDKYNMNYVFVNKNKLIPKTIIFDKNELNLALQLLQKKVNKKNVYIVSTYKNINLSIIFFKNNKLYKSTCANKDINEFNNDDIDFIKQFELDKIKILDTDIIKLIELIEPYSYNNSDTIGTCDKEDIQVQVGASDKEDMQVQVGASDKEDMQVQVGASDKGDIQVQVGASDKGDMQVQVGESDKENMQVQVGASDKEDIQNLLKEQLNKECNDIMQLYNNQKDKVNRLNRDILIIDKKERKIQQVINDKKFDSLTRLHNDLKIYDELCLEQVETPILFCKKYEYFKNTSENIKSIYDKIKLIDINKLLDEGITSETIQKYNLDELFNISNIYNTNLKELNVSFEHSWSELDADID